MTNGENDLDSEGNLPPPRTASIVIYPEPGKVDSRPQYLSALAGYTKSLLSRLPAEEQQRHLILTNQKTELPRSFRDGDIRVEECWRKGELRFVFQIVRTLRRFPTIDVIHLQHEFNQFGPAKTIPCIPLLLWILRFIYRKKIIVTWHEVLDPKLLTKDFLRAVCIPYPAWFTRIAVRLYYFITSLAISLIFVQDQAFEDVLRRLGVRKPIKILRIGADDIIDLPTRQTARSRHGINSDEHVVLFFGTLDWRKGLDLMIDTMNMTPDLRFRLVIAGGQPPRIRDTTAYKRWLDALEKKMACAQDRIIRRGFIEMEELSEWMAAADLMILPYIVPQRISAVLNLAISAEMPIIASEHINSQTHPSQLFPATSEGLKEKLAWAFEHLDELREITRELRTIHSWNNSASVLSEAYQMLVEKT